MIEILSLSEDDQNSMRYKLKGFKTGVHDGIYDGNVDSNCDSDKDGVATLADCRAGCGLVAMTEKKRARGGGPTAT